MAIPTAVARRPVKPLAYLGGFFAYGLGLSALYATTGVGFACPFRWLTGWDCPLCGATRMGSALLHADISAAWTYNPLVLMALFLLAGLGVLWSIELLRGRQLPRPAAVRRLAAVHPTVWLVLGLTGAAVYTVLRNLG